MDKNILDTEWERFEKTGNVVDYLKYKRRESMKNLVKMNTNDMEIGRVEGARNIENMQSEGDSNQRNSIQRNGQDNYTDDR